MRQSTSFGNLTDEQSMEFIYRTQDRRNGNLIKRTKSFWKFGKSDDEILEGMAMWRHRDLVQTDNEKSAEKERETTLKRLRKKSLEKSTSISTNSSETLKNVPNDSRHDSRHDLTLILDDGSKYPLTKSDIDQRISQQQQHDEQIYGRTEVRPTRPPQKVVSRSKLLRKSYMEMEQEDNKYNNNTENKRVSKPHPQPVARTNKPAAAYNEPPKSDRRNGSPKVSSNQDIIEFYDTRHLEPVKLRKHAYDDADLDDSIIIGNNSGRHMAADNAFFDDESVNGEVVMKTVNRQEILKQYYSSGTDTERHSASSSDPYDCIVVEDHLVQKENEKNKQSNPKMEFSTFRGEDKAIEKEKSRAATLLPRTKLTKTSSKERGQQQEHKRDEEYSSSNEKKRERTAADRNGKHRNGDHGRPEQDRKKSNGNNNNRSGSHDNQRPGHLDSDSNKSYGQWYDLWGRDASVNQ